MAKQTVTTSEAQDLLRRKNRYKVIRTIAQIAALLALALYLIVPPIVSKLSGLGATSPVAAVSSNDSIDSGSEPSFIAISYPGLTKSKSLDSKIINRDVFSEQITALKNAGYVTISQDDIVNFYQYYGSLPRKALFLIFEDGIQNTTDLAQEVLDANNYHATVCSYANNIDAANSKFINANALKALQNKGGWEIGTNGYRLAYINVFDRYGNYFGNLNADEFVNVYTYLYRDYNHYLMDFKRDEDRLRQERVDELKERILKDYDLMRLSYTQSLGSVPGLYILMHSNTGAFATDPIASDANRDGLTSIFSMNFNRQGTCLNKLNSSIYDLSRLQVQSYFSTNHLLMRIKDDIGEDLSFVTGDEQEAENWYLDKGAAQFKGDQIILTSEPRGEGRMTLKSKLLYDLDMTATLQGNLAGYQSINLRTDRDLKRGIQVALENNELVIRDLSADGAELFRQDLFKFDGGPYISQEEDEHNGLVALQKALIQFDEDADRVAKAEARLAELENTPVLTLQDGGTPYYPELNISDRGNRKLRIRLVASRISVWIDGKPVVEQLQIPASNIGAIAFGAQSNSEGKYSQRYYSDDVYDTVVIDPIICDAEDPRKIYYAYTLVTTQTINARISGWFISLVDFFIDNF